MPHPSIQHIVRSIQHIDSLRTNKRNFHHMFRITRLVSLARHTHDDHHFVRKGLFSKGEYPRHQEVPTIPTPPKQEGTSATSMKGHHRTTLERNATFDCSSRRIAILRDHVGLGSSVPPKGRYTAIQWLRNN